MNNNGNGGDNNGISNIDIAGLCLDLIGIIINLENLRLNEEQTNGIMQELSENQDKILAEIVELCKVIVAQNERLEQQNDKIEKLLQNLLNSLDNTKYRV